MTKNHRRRICHTLITTFLASLAVSPAVRADQTWTGAIDATWSTPGNWSTAEPTLADIAIFPTPVPGTGATITLSAGEQASSLLFQDSYTLTGGDLTLGTAASINVGPTFTAAVNSVLGVGPTTLTKQGNGTLILGGTNIYTGKTIIQAGTLSISADANLGAAPGAAVNDQLTLGGGTLKFAGVTSLAANRGVTVSAGTANTIDLNGLGTTGAPIGWAASSTWGNTVGTSLLLTTPASTTAVLQITGAGTNATIANGTLTIDTGVTLQLGNAGAAGNFYANRVPTTLNSGAVMRFNRNNATSYNAPISGAGSLTINSVAGQIVTLTPTNFTAGSTNTYSGGTNLSGGNSVVLGGHNTAFGTGPINFTAGAGTVASDSATARNFGNTLNIQGAAGTVSLGQTATGTGALTFGDLNLDRGATAIARTVTTNVATTFGAINDGAAGALASNLTFTGSVTRTITGNGTFSGTMSWSSGFNAVIGPNASLASTGNITQGDNGGADETVQFGSTLVAGIGDLVTIPGGLNRISDTSTYNFNGTGGFVYNGAAAGSTGTTETIGAISIPSGRAYITLNPSSDAPLGIVVNTVTRTAGTALFVRGTGLGTVGNGSATFSIGNAAALLSGGGGAAGSTNVSILPFAVGDASSTDGGTGFLTHDVNGVRLLTAGEYDSSIAGAGALRNVSAVGGETVAANATINSLRLTGGTTTIAANTSLQPKSGAVLFTGAATLAGPGTLEFGTGEGVFNVASSAAIAPTLSARIAGTGGLTFTGSTNAATTNNVLVLGGDNLANGTYTIDTGLTLRLGSATALNDNAPVALAFKPQSIVQINGNNVAVRNFVLLSFAGTLQNNAATDATLTTYQTAAQTFATGTTINNGATGKLNLVFHGNNTLTSTVSNTSGNYSYTGTTEVRTGGVNVSGNSAGFLSGTTGVIVNGGTFQVTNTTGTTNQTDRVNNAATVTLNNGTFDFNNNAGTGTTYSETVGALTVNSGTNIVTVDKAVSGQTSTLTFASLARNPGSWVLFNSQNNGTAIFDLGTTQNKLVFTAAPTLDDGLIGGWALYDTSATTRNFATYSAGVANLTGQITTLASGANPTVNYSLSASPAALTGNTQINSLVITQAAATAVDLGAFTLRVESGGMLVQGNTFTSTFSNGILTAGTGDNTAGELIFNTHTGATVALTTATIGNNGSGAVTLTKTGQGTLDLSGVTNTFTGKTYISGGTLKATGDAALGTAPGALVADALVISNGSVLDFTGATASFTLNANRGITVGANTTAGAANIISIPAGLAGLGKTLTYNGAITSLGTTEGSLTFKSNLTTTNLDPGKFVGTLSALNLNGSFRLEAGTVSVSGASSVLGRGLQVGVEGPASLTYTAAGGSLKIGAGINATDLLEIGIVNTDPGPVNTAMGTSTLDVSALSNFTANVTTIRLGVGNTNRYARGVFLGATNNDITASTSILVSRSAGANSAGTGANSTMTFGSGTNNVTTPLMSVGELKGEGTVNIAAGGTLNMGGFGANTMDLNVGLNAGSTGTVCLGTVNITGGTLTASLNNLIIASKSGGGAGGATGTFTVTGTGNNISANAVTIAAVVGDNAATTAATTGTLNFGGGSFTVNGDIAIATWDTNTVGTPTSTGSLNITGGTLNLGGNITRTTTDQTRSNSFVNVSGGTLNGLNAAAGDATPATITASQLALRAGSITNVATANLAATSSTNSGVAGTTGDALILRDVTAGFAVNLTGAMAGNIHYEAAGAGSGAILTGAIDLGAFGRTVNVENSAGAAADLTIGGAITGNVLLTKTGAGTLLLNSTVAGPVTASAGTLGGFGTITGAVNIGSTATLAPGASIGTLATGDLTFGAGSIFALEINTNTLTQDVAAVTGNLALDLGNTVTLTISDLNAAVLSSATLGFITYTGTWNGGFFKVGGNVIDDYDASTNPNSAGFVIAGNSYQIDYNAGGNTVALVVPEPGAVVMLLGGFASLAGLRRSRRRA